ncbi:unnamed protein product [Peronospora belbahrii]|uniref:Protein kinase domain-containing protein n=1 Tax=Peronospora belbahrii TaxID=622444 RepID=A0AAU9KW91_9STRA|nr:unnamed protein product [Peronospora belbahrii]
MISNSTREKAKATKAYLEQKYATMKREREESRERRDKLEQQMTAMRLTERKKEQYRQELRNKELQSLRHQRKRLAVGDFQPLAVIGRGAFGELTDLGLCKKMDSRVDLLPVSQHAMKPEQAMSTATAAATRRGGGGNSVDASRSKPFSRNRQVAFSTVGTPDYIAPEVLAQKGYDEPVQTCRRIVNWKQSFGFPPEAIVRLSPQCLDFVQRLICNAESRLGTGSVEDIKRHPWFNGVDWATLRSIQAPYIPPGGGPQFDYVLEQLQMNDPDQSGPQYQELVRQITSNFDEFTEPCELPVPAPVQVMGQAPPAAPMSGPNGVARGNHAVVGDNSEGELPQAFGSDGKPLTFNKFIGYTYKRKSPVRMALNDGLFDNGSVRTASRSTELENGSGSVQYATIPSSYESHADAGTLTPSATSNTNNAASDIGSNPYNYFSK